MTDAYELEDTDERILSTVKTQIGGMNVAFEISSWDGFKQISFIFESSQASEMTDEELTNLIIENNKQFSGKSFGVSRGDNKIFVNTSIDELFED